MVRHERTVSDGAGLGFVKSDHLGSFGANLNLFIDLKTQENYTQLVEKWKDSSVIGWRRSRSCYHS